MERVVITGIGLATPNGLGTAETWRSVLAAESGIRPITLFDTSDYAVRFAGEVPGFVAEQFLPKKKLREMGRFAHISIAASKFCLEDAAITLTDEDRETCGTFIGVGLGGLDNLYHHSLTLRDKGPSRVSPYFIPSVIANLAAGQVAMAFGLRGPSYCNTSACASGAHALGEAFEWIRRGRTQIMLAGGAESTITGLCMAGFNAMYALSRRNDDPQRASRPWDRDRDGFVVGEGAASLMLESLTHAKARGARIYAEITGYGASCDAYHLTKPAPEGEGAQRAIRMALSDAKLAPQSIDYVNAHATSTPQGDLEEAKAIVKVFGDHALSKNLWVSSTKSVTGHMLGAAGAVEAAFCAMALNEGKVPPTANLENQDPEVPFECVAGVMRERSIRHALSNSFGFGGTNATLVFSRFEG